MFISTVASVIGIAVGAKALFGSDKASRAAASSASDQTALARDSYNRGVGLTDKLMPESDQIRSDARRLTGPGGLYDVATNAVSDYSQRRSDYQTYSRPIERGLYYRGLSPDVYANTGDAAEDSRRVQARQAADAEAGRVSTDARVGESMDRAAIQREMQRTGAGSLADPRNLGALSANALKYNTARLGGMNLARRTSLAESDAKLFDAAKISDASVTQGNNAASLANSTVGNIVSIGSNALNTANIANAPANAGMGSAISGYSSAGMINSGLANAKQQGLAGFGKLAGTVLSAAKPWWAQKSTNPNSGSMRDNWNAGAYTDPETGDSWL